MTPTATAEAAYTFGERSGTELTFMLIGGLVVICVVFFGLAMCVEWLWQLCTDQLPASSRIARRLELADRRQEVDRALRAAVGDLDQSQRRTHARAIAHIAYEEAMASLNTRAGRARLSRRIRKGMQ